MQASSPITVDHIVGNVDVPAASYTGLRDPGRLTDVVVLIAQGDTSTVDAAVGSAHGRESGMLVGNNDIVSDLNEAAPGSLSRSTPDAPSRSRSMPRSTNGATS